MASRFSAAAMRTPRRPNRQPSRFFEQVILEYRLSHELLESRVFLPQRHHFARRRLTADIPHEPFLTRLEKLFAPAVVQIGRQALFSAQRNDAFFTAQPLEHDPNLLLDGKPPTRLPADLLDNLL